jgi:hypothetical protein
MTAHDHSRSLGGPSMVPTDRPVCKGKLRFSCGGQTKYSPGPDTLLGATPTAIWRPAFVLRWTADPGGKRICRECLPETGSIPIPACAGSASTPPGSSPIAVRCFFAAIFRSRIHGFRNIHDCPWWRAVATSLSARKRPSFAAVRYAGRGDTIIKVLLDSRR